MKTEEKGEGGCSTFYKIKKINKGHHVRSHVSRQIIDMSSSAMQHATSADCTTQLVSRAIWTWIVDSFLLHPREVYTHSSSSSIFFCIWKAAKSICSWKRSWQIWSSRPPSNILKKSGKQQRWPLSTNSDHQQSIMEVFGKKLTDKWVIYCEQIRVE